MTKQQRRLRNIELLALKALDLILEIKDEERKGGKYQIRLEDDINENLLKVCFDSQALQHRIEE